MDLVAELGLTDALEAKIIARLYLSADDRAFHEQLQRLVNTPRGKLEWRATSNNDFVKAAIKISCPLNLRGKYWYIIWDPDGTEWKRNFPVVDGLLSSKTLRNPYNYRFIMAWCNAENKIELSVRRSA